MNRKHKGIRIAALLLLGAMLLTGCGQRHSVQSTNDVPEIALPNVKETVSNGIEVLRDDPNTKGYASENGYYFPVIRESDGSENICYIDFETGQEIVLCSQLNCTHDNEACSAWIPTSQARNLIIPVGEKVIILHGGNPNFSEVLGDASLAKVEIMNPDGTDRKLIHTFAATERVPSLPRAGFAKDNKNLYFAIESTMAGDRFLYAVNIETEKVSLITTMAEPEERIVGGYGRNLILEYTPNAYDFSKKGSELITQVVRFDLETKERTPIFQHDYINVGVCVDNRYILLQQNHKIRTYDLETGKVLHEEAVELSEDVLWDYLRYDGFYGGKLMVRISMKDSIQTAEGIQTERHYGIDPKTGKAIEQKRYYVENTNDLYAYAIVAEAKDRFLIQSDTDEVIANLPRTDGVIGQDLYYVPRYAFVEKESFWNNTDEITPVIDATK